MPFQTGGAAGVKTLSDLQIDVDKDWKAHGIYNLGDLTPKVDGAYNLGSSGVQFDTIYANVGPPPGADSIGRKELKKPAVDSAYLFDNAVTSPKMASDSIYKRHFRTGTVENAYLVNDSITSNALGALTGGGAAALGGSRDISLAAGDVDTVYLANNAVDNAKLDNATRFTMNGIKTTGQISVAADGAYNLASSAYQFNAVYSRNVTVGDIRMGNEWKITEHPEYGIALESPEGVIHRIELKEEDEGGD